MRDDQIESWLHQAEGCRVRQKATGERQKVAGHRGKAEGGRGKAEQDSQSQMMETRGHTASRTGQ